MVKHSKIVYLSVLYLCFFIIPVFGQTTIDSTENSLLPESWSLQFQIGNNFTLGSFQGSNISAKKHFGKNRAIRFGISLSGVIDDNNTENMSENDNKLAETKDTKNNSATVYLSGYYLYYTTAKSKINLYFGTGPVVGFTLDGRETIQEQLNDSLVHAVKEDRNTDSWSVGIHFLIGTEWFFTKHISVLAEYGTSLSYSWLKSNITRKTESTNYGDSVRKIKMTDNRYSFKASTVKFGLSVYF